MRTLLSRRDFIKTSTLAASLPLPAWRTRAEPPVIANVVIFAYGSGEDTDQARFDIGLACNNDAKYRISNSTKAALYALDAQTGKELWNSGDQIASWSHWGGLSVANGAHPDVEIAAAI